MGSMRQRLRWVRGHASQAYGAVVNDCGEWLPEIGDPRRYGVARYDEPQARAWDDSSGLRLSRRVHGTLSQHGRAQSDTR